MWVAAAATAWPTAVRAAPGTWEDLSQPAKLCMRICAICSAITATRGAERTVVRTTPGGFAATAAAAGRASASATRPARKAARLMMRSATTAAPVAELAKEPFPHGVKKLVGSEFSYRLRVGDYRVV